MVEEKQRSPIIEPGFDDDFNHHESIEISAAEYQVLNRIKKKNMSEKIKKYLKLLLSRGIGLRDTKLHAMTDRVKANKIEIILKNYTKMVEQKLDLKIDEAVSNTEKNNLTPE